MDKNEYPYNEIDRTVKPQTVRLIGFLDHKFRHKFGYSVRIYQMVTGRYGYVLVEHRGPAGDVEHPMWAGYDEPWNAIRAAISEMNEQRAVRESTAE